MKMLWSNKTGLAKVAAILAVVLGVSLGLCGVNVVVGVAAYGGSVWQALLTGTSVLATAGIVGSLVGLVLVGLLALARRLFTGSAKDE